jgi:perosamine synthetase
MEQLSRAVTENTLCVVPDHLFGIPSDMEPIRRLCRNRGAYLIEDAAQAMGGAIKGKKLGTLGDAGFFSLGRGKNITCGSGGIILTDSDPIAGAVEREHSSLAEPGRAEEFLELLKAVLLSIFIRPSLYRLPAGLSFLKLGKTIFYRDFPLKRLSGLQAGLLRRWQERLEQSNRARRENSGYFCGALGLKIGNGLPRPLLRLPVLADGPDARNTICSISKEKGLGISSMYPAPVNRIRELEEQFAGRNFPNAERIAGRIMTLPTHQLLSARDKRAIARFLLSMNKGDADQNQPRRNQDRIVYP